MDYYISSCMFTRQFPDISKRIRDYILSKYDIECLRCCVPNWAVKEHEENMPCGILYEEWKNMPQSEVFTQEDHTWSLCPNCINIIDEWRGAHVHSLWELIDQDESFIFPDYSGLKVTIQDCWRLKERIEVQEAVRSILKKMNIEFVEIKKHHQETDFCGKTLYRPQIKRNYTLAPKHYKENAIGLFEEHSEEEQNELMKEHCEQYETDIVICYCHYCLEGLIAGGVDGRHLAELLFK